MPKKKTETKKVGSKKAEVETKKALKNPYRLQVSFNDEEFDIKASSLSDALKELVNDERFTRGVKTRVLITYGDGSMTRNAIFSVPRARRIFSMLSVKDVSADVFANQLMLGLTQ